MRVGILTREFPPEVYGGAGVHVEHLAAELAHHIEVAVHCFGAPRSSPLVAAAYQPWSELQGGGRPEETALAVMSVDLAMARGLEGVDLVHSHTWYANLAGHLAKLLWGVPHVCTTHSLEPLRPWKAEQLGGGYALSLFCERTALLSADSVIAVSEAMRRDLLACYPIDPDRVHAIHNGIDAGAYRPDRSEAALIRHGIDPTRPVVLYVGRITRQKGLSHLVRAAARIDRAAQLVLVAGTPDTPEIAAEIRTLHDAAVAEGASIVWIREMVPRPELVQLLSHATAFVCPSVYEPFGLVNLEAMACEAAVVASEIGGIPEIVVPGETGYLVACDPEAVASDPTAARDFEAALADRINQLVADPALASRLGAAGRRRVMERFTWERVAARTLEVYRSVLGLPPAGA
jgi:starch synthase